MIRRALVLAALLLAGCLGEPASTDDAATSTPTSPATSAAPTAPTAHAVGPNWTFVDIEGVSHSRDAPPGNATVLFFMATWCPTCREEAPILAGIHEDYAAKGVRMYTLSFDPTEGDEDLRGWQERYHQPWPHATDEELRLQRAFRVTSQSSVVLLDVTGHVEKHFGYGQISDSSLRAALDATLAQA